MEYGLIGEKLSHSFSKEIHTELFGYDYSLKEIKREDLETFLKKREFKAINVTVPYKRAVIPFLDVVSDNAKRIGTVNTVVNKNGKLYGYNTDYDGMKALIEKSGIEIKDKKVLILGSGGTSNTARTLVKDLFAREVIIVSRTKSDRTVTYFEAVKFHNDADVIINTTPVGMYPDLYASPIEIAPFTRLKGIIDVIYNPLSSDLVTKGKMAGIKSTGGLYMLILQAVFVGKLFCSKDVEIKKVNALYEKIKREKSNIVLIGMPSSGKSTIGKMLSDELNMAYYDTDLVIEKNEGKSPKEIICSNGENYFRTAETTAVREVSKLTGVIISTGGGTVLRKENIEALKSNGIIYFIDRKLENLVCDSSRPLSSDFDLLKKRYLERIDLYNLYADKVIDNNGDTKDTVKMIKEDFCNENTCN